MRGLAFPSNAVFDREPSYEYGTPTNNNADAIPIDPALGGPPIDPELMAEGNATVEPVQPRPQYLLAITQPEQSEYTQTQQYSQAPQGDPFAPQPVAPFLELEPEQPAPPPKPVRRKRKVKREEECSFCQGNDAKNKVGKPEQMVTCSECGRSGHPSCMQLSEIGDHLRLYDWKCMECKNCELCHEKGDDERILFCDWCDRGWHLDCMDPPMPHPPDGKWHCPMCPPLLPEEEMLYGHPDIQAEYQHPPFTPSVRESSIASSSRSVQAPPKTNTRARVKRVYGEKGKSRQPAPGQSDLEENNDEDMDIEVEPENIQAPRRGRARPKLSKKGKSRAQKLSVVQQEEEEEIEEVEIEEDEEGEDVEEAPAPRPIKRKRGQDHSPITSPPRVWLRLSQQKGKGKEREEDEPPPGLFDDMLRLEDRDTSKTSITNWDKQSFERSRLVAEQKLTPPRPPPPTASSMVSDATEMSISSTSRPLRSSTLRHPPAKLPTPATISVSPGPSTPGPLSKLEPGALRIRTIRFGQYDIKTWYDAPFPEEYANIPDGRLWICEFCLKYMKSRFGAGRHRMKCKARHPPGDEIYRDASVSIFEVDGRRNKIYCQNLCLLSKMFLDHKSLFYDVEPFLFYVITEVDDVGARFVGYFSKEKRSPKDYNVSCIMTLPVRQRQGWGNLLIDFSYLLSKKEQRTGSPEKPLSSLGALGYKNYWTLSLMRYLDAASDHIRLEDISVATSMTIEDICETLIQQNMIYIRDATPPAIRPSPGQSIKFPKGRKNGIARRHLQRMQTKDKESDGSKGPFIPPKHYEIRFDREKVASYLQAWEAKGYLKLRPEKLQWAPYLISRTKKEDAVEVETPALGHLDEANKAATQTNGDRQGTEAAQTPDPRQTSESATEARAPSESIMVDSPAAALFDDEDALPVVNARKPPPTRSQTRSPMKALTRTESTPTRRKKPSPMKEMEIDSVPRRRLRGQSSQISLPSTPKPESMESPRRPRGRPTRTSSRLAGTVDEDEALAAKLAQEERRQGGRQLRSRASESHIVRRNTANSPPSITPARKRRRVESSAEAESPEAERSPSPDAAPVEESAADPALNGIYVNSEADAVHISSQKPESVERESRVVCESKVPEEVPSKPPSVSVATVTSQNGFVVKKIADKRDDLNEPDVKSEEVGTPLTSITSHQSIPSDDTVFGSEIMRTKHPNGIPGINGHAESDLRSTLVAGEAEAVGKAYLEEEDGEADADGEYEEDAEGEPDPELLEGGLVQM